MDEKKPADIPTIEIDSDEMARRFRERWDASEPTVDKIAELCHGMTLLEVAIVLYRLQMYLSRAAPHIIQVAMVANGVVNHDVVQGLADAESVVVSTKQRPLPHVPMTNVFGKQKVGES